MATYCALRPAEHEAALTPAQVAASLQVSNRTVLDLIRSGELPAVKVGQQWRVRPAVLEAYLCGAALDDPEPLSQEDLEAVRVGVEQIIRGELRMAHVQPEARR